MVRTPFRKLVVGLVGAFVAVVAWAQAPAPGERISLGARQVGQSYPFNLIAQNLNCNQPQDFKFVISPNPWLKIQGDPVARQVQRGQQKAVQAKIDFSRLRPGIYRAQVTVICDTCQFLVFANCKISDRVMYLEVEATAPPPPAAAARPQPQPQGQARPRTGSVLADPPSVMASFDPDLVPWMNAAARRAAEDAQRKADDAAAAAKRAADELEGEKKKKGPCEEELAAARAAAAAADAEAAAAQAAAEAATSAAEAAEKAAADNAKDLADAEKEMGAAQTRLGNAAAARSALIKDGANASAVAAAQKMVDEANDAAYAAQKKFSAARAAAAGLAEAAATAAEAANAATAASSAAAARAAAAAAALAAKEAECLGIAAAEKAAQAKADAAAAAAGAAADEAAGAKKKAEDDARGARILTLEEQLEAARKRCKQIYEDQLANAKKQEKALAALKKLGVLGPDTPTDGLDEMWNDWGSWATGVVTGASAVAGGFAAGGKAIPTGGGPQMILSALQAAYGILNIRLVTLTPNTKAFLTDREVYGENSQANQWVRSNGFADTPEEAEEVLDEMERIVNDPDTIAKDMANAMSQLDACKQEVADLEAKLEAAKAGG